MGRAPCCDKANVKKGPWSPEEDLKLKLYIEKHGTGGNWISLPQKAGLRRCGKSCRLRWLNYLRPDIKHGEFSDEEDRLICTIFSSIGSRWSIIAAQLPGRTDNDIKNYWNTKLKKKLMMGMSMHLPPPSVSQRKPHQASTTTYNNNNFYYLTNLDQTPPISIPQIHQSSKTQESVIGPLRNCYQMKDNMLSFGGGGGDHQASCCTSSDGSSNNTGEPIGRNHLGQLGISSPSSNQTYHQGIHGDYYNSNGGVNCGWNEEKPSGLWGSNIDDQTPIVDYGFEEIKELISTNNMCDNFLVDENNAEENFMYY